MTQNDWSLKRVLADLHDDVERRLGTARRLGHPVAKGDASEMIWLELLQTYLPKRYSAERAHVVDSKGAFSDSIDVLIFDRQYSPFVFQFEGQTVVPAESVYGVFEAKQKINAKHIRCAQDKVASVRRLHRTSLPIPYAEGTYRAKPPIPVLGGILAFESDWSPSFGAALRKSLATNEADKRLDLGCVAAHGHFRWESTGAYNFVEGGKPATAFLLELIARLQSVATVPMIDVRAYGHWLAD